MSNASPPSPAASAVQHFQLANGLQVWLRQDPRAPVVTAQLWYHIGSSDETPGKTGLSHALEHLMFQGSGKLTPGQYQHAISRLGATPDAYTTKDGTAFEMSLPVPRLETALEILADSMRSATLGEAEFPKVLDVIKAERRSQIDNSVEQIALERIRQAAYGSSGYAIPVIGHAADLERLRLEDVRGWYDTWYWPNNASLIVVGAIELDALRTLVERQFSGIVQGTLPPRPLPRLARPAAQQRFTLEHPILKTGVAIAFPAPSLATTTQPSQAFALLLLREMLASRLHCTLVRNSPVLSSANVYYNPLQRGDSLFALYGFRNDETDTEQVLGLVSQQIERLRQAPTDTSELERLKARLMAQEVFAQDSHAAQAWLLGLYASSGLDPAQTTQRLDSIRALTSQDMRQAAETCLAADSASVMILQKEQNPDE